MMSIYSRLIRKTYKAMDDKRDAGLSTPSSIKRFNDIPYGPHPKWHLLDVYYPKETTKKRPVIISIHGGGWVYGTKETYQFYTMSLAERGFVVINFNYRLAPESRYPAQLEDINRVMHWMFEHADDYMIDVKRVYLVGDSAGAHLASLYASLITNEQYQRLFDFMPPKMLHIKAMALNCGIYDIDEAIKTDLHLKKLLKNLLGRHYSPSQLSLVKPLLYLNENYPPVYLMTSNKDFLKDQAPFMKEKLEAFHIAHRYHVYGDEDTKLYHVFHCNIKLKEAGICNDDECEFFRQHQ